MSQSNLRVKHLPMEENKIKKDAADYGDILSDSLNYTNYEKLLH